MKNLMLREDVVEAVREGQFHIYPVSTIDEGIGLLTGIEAGERKMDGRYPENTPTSPFRSGSRNWPKKSRFSQ